MDLKAFDEPEGKRHIPDQLILNLKLSASEGLTSHLITLNNARTDLHSLALKSDNDLLVGWVLQLDSDDKSFF